MRQMMWLVAVVAVGLFLKGPNIMAADTDQVAVVETKLGKIVIEFYDKDAPKTVANFIKLAKQGFYDGTTFHRVIPGFMIQGGDPNSKNRTGARMERAGLATRSRRKSSASTHAARWPRRGSATRSIPRSGRAAASFSSTSRTTVF